MVERSHKNFQKELVEVNDKFGIIARMDEGDADPDVYLKKCKARADDAPALLRANGDLHVYIVNKLFELLLGIRNNG